MAEAIFNHRGPAGWRAISAGVSPARATNPNTGPMLAEIGVPAPSHSPQGLTKTLVQDATVRVSIGATDHPSCPEWFARAHPVEWTIPDTHYADAEGFRAIREEIRSKVDALIDELGRRFPRDRSSLPNGKRRTPGPAKRDTDPSL